MLQFSKYQGAGNDFILIDNRSSVFNKDSKLIERLCNRRFGIGADGLILLENAAEKDLDFKMVYYNADGLEGSMCGNGGRCIVRFAQSVGAADDTTRFVAVDGIHQAHTDGKTISLKMTDVTEILKIDDDFLLNTGSPHFVRMVDDIHSVAVTEEGKDIRYSTRFKKEGVNVNFVEQGAAVHQIRTYERGVEAETLACGTGAVAAALCIADRQHTTEGEIHLKARGGDLSVSFLKKDKGYENIWLSGPAEITFKGQIDC